MDPVDFVKLRLSKLFHSKVNKRISNPLGAYVRNNRIFLLFQNKVNPAVIDVAQSEDEFNFNVHEAPYDLDSYEGNPVIRTLNPFTHGKSIRFICTNNTGSMLGELQGNRIFLRPIAGIKEIGAVVSNYTYKDQSVLYFGERAICIAYSSDMKEWKAKQKPLIIDSYPLEVGSVFETERGLLLLYFRKEIDKGFLYHYAHMALFDKKNPEKIIWKTSEPVWRQKDHWADKNASHLGTVFHNNRLLSYWFTDEKIINCVLIAGFKFDPHTIETKKVRLKKHASNPIISPKSNNDWEAFNTFNPAALYADRKVHILYRAQGFDYVSTVGYAASRDGISIHERSGVPIYAPRMDFENNDKESAQYDFMSGGGMGGCEDPRVTLLEDRVYMTYVAFDGWSPPRLALTSISLDDFLNKRWLWSKPVLISPPGIIDKSGCLLPEKINGKYVFFHRVFPNILIDFIDDLNFDGKTKWLKGQYQIKIRDNKWDSRKIGAGAPPLKTKDGWLLIYYGVDDRDASKYHVGAMLLDLKDPTKVLHRTNHPILEPKESYENNGFKPGIAYPCGAVIIKDKLFVYYGGADSVVCVATADLQTFLEELKSTESGHLEQIQIREVDY